MEIIGQMVILQALGEELIMLPFLQLQIQFIS